MIYPQMVLILNDIKQMYHLLKSLGLDVAINTIAFSTNIRETYDRFPLDTVFLHCGLVTDRLYHETLAKTILNHSSARLPELNLIATL